MDENEDNVYFYGATPTNAFTLRVTDTTEKPQQPQPLEESVPSSVIPSSRLPSSTSSRHPQGPSWSNLVKNNLPSSTSSSSLNSNTISGASSSSSPTTLCSFYLAGWCRSGAQCKFSHETADDTTVHYFLQEIEKLRALDDKNKNNKKILPSSSSSSSSTEKETDDSEETFQLASQQWQTTSNALRDTLLQEAVRLGYCSNLKLAESGLQAAERQISKDTECGICLEKVMEQRGRRFGLLSNCTHAFCLGCIREWRAKIDLPKRTTRACPLCRTTSYYVISSDRYIADPSRKVALIEEVQTSKQTIPCKHWNYGRGECPFGSSCFYAHLNPDGSVCKLTNNHSFRMDSNGVIKGGTIKYQLNQFLEEEEE